jgi:hypothetical protein
MDIETSNDKRAFLRAFAGHAKGEADRIEGMFRANRADRFVGEMLGTKLETECALDGACSLAVLGGVLAALPVLIEKVLSDSDRGLVEGLLREAEKGGKDETDFGN